MNEDFTVEELEEYIEDEFSYKMSYFSIRGTDGFFSHLWHEANSLQTKFGLIERVQKETDYDEGRELRSLIVKVNDRFFKKVGYYDSWDSCSWDGNLFEVAPFEKTVIEYVPKC